MPVGGIFYALFNFSLMGLIRTLLVLIAVAFALLIFGSYFKNKYTSYKHEKTVMTEKLQVESEEKLKVWKKQLSQNEKRIAELDRLFIKIYEDNAKGTLSDEKFEMMSQRYEEEQSQLKSELVTLQENIEVQEQQTENLEQFIQLASKYADGVPLTPYSLRELVKRIYVSAADKSSGKRKQSISIEYDFIGFIPLNELMQKKSA